MKLSFILSLFISCLGVVLVSSEYNVHTSLASKYERKSSQNNILTVGPTINSGYLQAKAYFNSNNCSTDIYAIEYLTLGVCAPYNANYSNPAAVPESCGKFVSAVAYMSTSPIGDLVNLNYTFHTDSSCLTAQTCVQSLSIQYDCYASTYGNNITTSARGLLSSAISIPENGYHAM